MPKYRSLKTGKYVSEYYGKRNPRKVRQVQEPKQLWPRFFGGPSEYQGIFEKEKILKDLMSDAYPISTSHWLNFRSKRNSRYPRPKSLREFEPIMRREIRRSVAVLSIIERYSRRVCEVPGDRPFYLAEKKES